MALNVMVIGVGMVGETIRICSYKDISILSHLIRCSFHDVAVRFGLTPENCPTHPSNCTDQWIISDFYKGIRYFILARNGFPCGCVALEKANATLVYLKRLAVLPEQRNQGFGTALVDHIIGASKCLGANRISIGMNSKQPELKTWYEKIGFVESETKAFDHLPFPVTYMALGLKQPQCCNVRDTAAI